MLTIGFNIALGTREMEMYIKKEEEEKEETKKEKEDDESIIRKVKKILPKKTKKKDDVHIPSSYDNTKSKEPVEIKKGGVLRK